jgi:hypothetical protein
MIEQRLIQYCHFSPDFEEAVSGSHFLGRNGIKYFNEPKGKGLLSLQPFTT